MQIQPQMAKIWSLPPKFWDIQIIGKLGTVWKLRFAGFKRIYIGENLLRNGVNGTWYTNPDIILSETNNGGGKRDIDQPKPSPAIRRKKRKKVACHLGSSSLLCKYKDNNGIPHSSENLSLDLNQLWYGTTESVFWLWNSIPWL
ncbi:hypothetical protein B0H14DRAFT_2582575 [Mycena olivaceomarginata]|nr:hypothetical protein B0H14DRAFT_2582575 [Mycena olivaceomarginata]